MIMLDSTACIDYLNGDEGIKEVINESDKMLNISTVSIYEVSIGLERTKRKISEARYTILYKRWIEFLTGVQIIILDIKEAERSSQIFDELEAIGERIDDNDILIAGSMLSNGITTIITRNKRHFEKIKDLNIIEY